MTKPDQLDTLTRAVVARANRRCPKSHAKRLELEAKRLAASKPAPKK